jgi:hypothetical protein
VYASQPESPPNHATLGSGWWPTFAGQDFHLQGRNEGFRQLVSLYMASSFSKLAWRKERFIWRRISYWIDNISPKSRIMVYFKAFAIGHYGGA